MAERIKDSTGLDRFKEVPKEISKFNIIFPNGTGGHFISWNTFHSLFYHMGVEFPKSYGLSEKYLDGYTNDRNEYRFIKRPFINVIHPKEIAYITDQNMDDLMKATNFCIEYDTQTYNFCKALSRIKHHTLKEDTKFHNIDFWNYTLDKTISRLPGLVDECIDYYKMFIEQDLKYINDKYFKYFLSIDKKVFMQELKQYRNTNYELIKQYCTKNQMQEIGCNDWPGFSTKKIVWRPNE